jgi:hypothetical protein
MTVVPVLVSTHPRHALFTGGQPDRVRSGRGRWRLPVNAGQSCWKACWQVRASRLRQAPAAELLAGLGVRAALGGRCSARGRMCCLRRARPGRGQTVGHRSQDPGPQRRKLSWSAVGADGSSLAAPVGPPQVLCNCRQPPVASELGGSTVSGLVVSSFGSGMGAAICRQLRSDAVRRCDRGRFKRSDVQQRPQAAALLA